ncbi:guanine nucleotide binding protein, alpha subunit [Crucibulum laeve]|uniref:Guanine nucleotide binding protein, alpha subunit n=1 Tax=Crucibulum laeve TaxID=68775 RepID=A0A5C3M1K9_9AGAR|nr:guanine nucleotide binding protein, alpha subunit [Crucibulum laeve]
MGMPEPDPFSSLLLPPANETAEEKALREQHELEAQRTSDRIDEQIKLERAALKKQKGIVRVLLLGQSESGKSTTLKNFRLKYARTAWKQERNSWRSVIQLNLLRSVNTILDVLQAEMDGEPVDRPTTSTSSDLVAEGEDVDGVEAAMSVEDKHAEESEESDAGVGLEGMGLEGMISIGNEDAAQARMGKSGAGTPNTSPSPTSASPSTLLSSPLLSASTAPTSPNPNSPVALPSDGPLTSHHQLLKLRLGPLRRVEMDLRRRLGAGAEEDYGVTPLGTVTNTQVTSASNNVGAGTGTLVAKRSRPEFGVREWKDALVNGQQGATYHGRGSQHGHGRASELGHGSQVGHESRQVVEAGERGDVDEATEVIASCREDMKALWMDPIVRDVLKKRRMRLEDSAGFFLDDLERIATRTYEPSDDDVVRARLRTLGVQEHRIQFDQSVGQNQFFSSTLGQDFGKEWILYDVGGSRTIRHAWLPYFDNVNAIIFLAPISCFDERLLEDSRVNRLEDSFLLWRAVCTSKLLAKTTMILFLNKCDLLKRKLKSGILVKNYLPSFGDRTNDAPTVVRYLREKFRDILKQHSPEPRVSYFYPTSVTDTKATATTLKTVRDSILREHLKSADFV